MKDAYMNLSFYQMWYFIRTIELGSYSRASQDLKRNTVDIKQMYSKHRTEPENGTVYQGEKQSDTDRSCKKSLSGVEKDDCGNAGSCGRCTALYGWTK